MTGSTHSKGGICFALILLNLFIVKIIPTYNFAYKILLVFFFFVGSYVGALFPDIDQKKSSISRALPFLAKTFGAKCRHRGFTHSLLCLGIFSLILFIISFLSEFNIIISSLCFGFVSGYISHLFLDLLTSDGIEIFYPCKTNFKLGFIKTGSKAEKFIDKFINFLTIALIGVNLYLLIAPIFQKLLG